MKVDVKSILFLTLRIALSENIFDKLEIKFCSDSGKLEEVFQTAQSHDIAHLVELGLMKGGVVSKNNISDIIMSAVFRYETQNYEFTRICEVLENAQIAFLPLKGSVMRSFYPEPWMRTSCDIDILVKKEDLRKAIDCLVDTLEYTEHEQNEYDVSLFTPGKIHIELHFGLIDDGISKEITRLLDNVWEYVSLKGGYSYWYEMTDAMFYFFHIAHMAKHFEIGGCGIRPFIDLWFLDNIESADISARKALLEKGDLLGFSEAVQKLSRAWLENYELDEITEKMQNYILTGGVYGSLENKLLAQQQKKGGKLRYVLSRIFLPYSVIKLHYPILQKYQWLTPIMQVRRWFKLLFQGVSRDTINELQYNNNISKHQAIDMKRFLREIGL